MWNFQDSIPFESFDSYTNKLPRVTTVNHRPTDNDCNSKPNWGMTRLRSSASKKSNLAANSTVRSKIKIRDQILQYYLDTIKSPQYFTTAQPYYGETMFALTRHCSYINLCSTTDNPDPAGQGFNSRAGVQQPKRNFHSEEHNWMHI